MLKVFLVEDEFVVREGIKNNIDWKAKGYEFCGEASDGELAFPMIKKRKPDIVITDIKMPFMDGLELSRLIKKEMPWIEIIILSGYEEFEYAKEAIKIGVAEYLTKPISGNDLLRAVDSLAEKMQEKLLEREIREKYQKEMEENFLKERKELFGHLVTGTKTTAELLDLGERLDVDLTAMWYNIILIKMQSKNQAPNEYSDELVESEEQLAKIVDKQHLLVFDRNTEGKAVLIKADSKEELENFQNEYLTKMKEILDKHQNIRYFVGVGRMVDRLRKVSESFEQASHAFAYRYLIEKSGIIYCEEAEQGAVLEKDEFDIHKVDANQIDRDKIKEFLKTGEKEEVNYFVEEFFKGLGASTMKSKIFRQYIVIDAYFCVLDFLKELEFSKEEMEPIEMGTETMYSIETAMDYVAKIIRQAVEMRERRAGDKYKDVVQEVMRYIEQYYADENLSLNMLASHVNFSPNHLSLVFSQQTGQTFIKYLTDFRMNKAKELLRCTGKKSSVIGMEIGYRDPHYFSYLFKKTQGMTPTQYRGGKTPEGEE